MIFGLTLRLPLVSDSVAAGGDLGALAARFDVDQRLQDGVDHE